MAKDRLNLDMTMKEVVAELSRENGGYNPGALAVCMDILTKGSAIDPACMSPFLPLLSLDSHRIYGSRIWMLFKDVCGQDIAKTLGLLRAVQLGFMSGRDLDFAIDNRGQGVDVAAMVAKVKERLPDFGKTE